MLSNNLFLGCGTEWEDGKCYRHEYRGCVVTVQHCLDFDGKDKPIKTVTILKRHDLAVITVPGFTPVFKHQIDHKINKLEGIRAATHDFNGSVVLTIRQQQHKLAEEMGEANVKAPIRFGIIKKG